LPEGAGGERNTDMPLPESIEEFLAQGILALAGISRSGAGYGNRVLHDLTAKRYQVLPVHPEALELGGHIAYPSLADLPEAIGGLVLVVPPKQSEKLVRQAAALGIPRVWMQPGAESADAITFCHDHGISVIYGLCIMVLSRNRSGT